MKKLASIIALISLAITLTASDWTFHGTKDNWTRVAFRTPTPEGGDSYDLAWDWNFDQLYPMDAYSGLQTFIGGNWSAPSGYSDVIIASIPDSIVISWVYIAGPAEDYNGFDMLSYSQLDFVIPGEWWIDFSSTQTLRISSTQPIDFGKWAAGVGLK